MDFGRMKENDFLDRLVALCDIGKNVKAELAACLDRRNGCGHLNSMKLGPNTVAHHLEIFFLNVFKVSLGPSGERDRGEAVDRGEEAKAAHNT